MRPALPLVGDMSDESSIRVIEPESADTTTEPVALVSLVCTPNNGNSKLPSSNLSFNRFLLTLTTYTESVLQTQQ